MHAKMDRAGKASSQIFHYINHEDLAALVAPITTCSAFMRCHNVEVVS